MSVNNDPNAGGGVLLPPPASVVSGGKADATGAAAAPAPVIGDTTAAAGMKRKSPEASLQEAFGKIRDIPGAFKALQSAVDGDYLDIDSVMTLTECLIDAAEKEAQKREASRETAREGMNLGVELGRDAAAAILHAGEIEAKQHEAEAAQHFKNGLISAIGAGVSIVSFAASTGGGAIARNTGSAKRMGMERDAALKAHEQSAASGAPKAQQQARQNDFEVKNQKYTSKMQNIDNISHQAGMMLNQSTGQIFTAASEFTKAEKEIEIAGLVRQRSYMENFRKMAETYEKVAQKMSQSADEDKRDSIDAMTKFLQALDQASSARHKAFGIGTHG